MATETTCHLENGQSVRIATPDPTATVSSSYDASASVRRAAARVSSSATVAPPRPPAPARSWSVLSSTRSTSSEPKTIHSESDARDCACGTETTVRYNGVVRDELPKLLYVPRRFTTSICRLHVHVLYMCTYLYSCTGTVVCIHRASNRRTACDVSNFNRDARDGADGL
jgi:hypothetical protein